METVTIPFKDRTEITAEVNGSNYITNSKPSFPDDLTDITIDEGGSKRTIENGRVIECAPMDNRYWFAIIEIPEQERILTHLQSSIDYIAIMADIDI